MSRARPYQELRDRLFTPEQQAKNDAKGRQIVREVTLRELRKSLAQFTQEELAEQLDVSQAQISKFEKGGDILVSNLRAFVEAMGGELRVQARLEDGDWVILEDYSSSDSSR
jgi:transcriptional regulator with XRE-family HTH domain